MLPRLALLCTVAVRHCLLALPGVEKGDIKRVLSHPQVRCARCGCSSEACSLSQNTAQVDLLVLLIAGSRM